MSLGDLVLRDDLANRFIFHVQLAQENNVELPLFTTNVLAFYANCVSDYEQDRVVAFCDFADNSMSAIDVHDFPVIKENYLLSPQFQDEYGFMSLKDRVAHVVVTPGPDFQTLNEKLSRVELIRDPKDVILRSFLFYEFCWAVEVSTDLRVCVYDYRKKHMTVLQFRADADYSDDNWRYSS